ncbi:DNA cytosine methyltransferase [Aureimonas pseudogalii]|uniref:Cytosine-specific methyltransferase n=1 Tax=Aureimonas pseudogalii TaxID=1744844 RepID=A0A7W6H5T2_9HYPH|nr:DNA (cytosine-5-)-methyltransferase [Aureimonas pseudogalii]MBB3999091.1 DNA-cytosine methyltransferase [Aureimonas pseudogalii]
MRPRSIERSAQHVEEAAGLLKGSFGAWVRHECKIEPRTVLGYRKVARHLSGHRKFLVKQKLTPSAAVILASAKPEGREAALHSLRSGRRINADEMKIVVSSGETRKSATSGLPAFRKAANSHASDVAGRLGRLVAEINSALETHSPALLDLAKGARPLSLQLVAMTWIGDPSSEDGIRVLSRALEDFAKARKSGQLEESAHGLVERFANFGNVEEPKATAPAPEAAPDTRTANQRRRALTSISTPFKHGLTSFEVCAGGGGQACGLSKAGFQHVGMLEMDPDACETLRANFGADHVIEANLVGYDPGDVGPIDLFAGGVPCQSFSKASSKRNGEDDDRDCFPEALRLIERMKPRAVMLENVEGLFGPDYDMYRHRILGRLGKLGYACEWRKVRCAWFGIPQTRVRTILVGFLEADAMSRFRWPEAVAHYKDEPYPVIGAIDWWLRSGGYVPSDEVTDAFDCVAPTILGGSTKKESMDFGQRKTAEKWRAMTLITTRWGELPPAPGHDGPILPANGLIAALQGFPADWKFRGDRHPVYRQIGNAFPPVVALHLGCAVATALTGIHHDPGRAISLQGTRFRLEPVRSTNADGTPREPRPPASALLPQTRDLRIRKLAATSSILLRENEGEFPHESVYPPHEGDDREEAELEHYVWYWGSLDKERVAQAAADGAGSGVPPAAKI